MSTYPPAAPTLTGDALTVHRFLRTPTLVQRRVNELQAQRFFSDFIFPERVELAGGSVVYEISSGLYTTKDPKAVAPGAEYPRAQLTSGASAIATATKWGQDVAITDEKIGRSPRRELELGLGQVGLSVRKRVDGQANLAVGAAITKSQAATAVWTGATAKAWLDVELASASIEDEELGYEADTVAVTSTLYAHLMYSLLPALPREQNGSVLTSGVLPQIGGKTVVSANLPAGTLAVVLDRSVFGFMGYERIPSPEYEGDPATGIETFARRNPDGNDEWLVRGRRPVVPVIDNPNAARRITGVI